MTKKKTCSADKRIVLLAGGVGGAKLADGFNRLANRRISQTVIVNTGDDFEHLGLRISPDLDTVLYTLAGIANPLTGWGRKDDSWDVLEELKMLGAPDWFALGDKDLAIHILRSMHLRAGGSLSEFTDQISRKLQVNSRILPMCDDLAPTLIETKKNGLLTFQEYFVKYHCEPEVKKIILTGGKCVPASSAVLDAISEADLVVIAPSNPFVSVGPILNLIGVKGALQQKTVVAVSPIVNRAALKGPAAKMFSELGEEPSAAAVAKRYKGIIKSLFIDKADQDEASSVEAYGIEAVLANIVMKTYDDRVRLAEEILRFGTR